VFSDECYSEIYTQHVPAGVLEAAGPDFANVVEFQSLSKRSNLPGLRIGFAAGDRSFLARFLELRNVAAPQVPMPMQRVAIAAYGDEAHVRENRRLYAQKFDLADQIIGDRYGYRRPAGGFFLWLDVSAQGGDEAVTLRLWREAGLRVVPGRYLARDQADGSNPGRGYIRVAMVQDQETTAEALHRLVADSLSTHFTPGGGDRRRVPVEEGTENERDPRRAMQRLPGVSWSCTMTTRCSRGRVRTVGLVAREIAAGHDAQSCLAPQPQRHRPRRPPCGRHVEPVEEPAGRRDSRSGHRMILVGEIDFCA